MTFADFDNQRVQFIGVASCFFAGCARNRAIPQGLQFRIARIGWEKLMACDHTAEVFVHDKHGMSERIEENGIGSFRADAGQRQQLRAKLGRRLLRHPIERASVAIVQKLHKGFDGGCLAHNKPGGANWLAQRFF